MGNALTAGFCTNEAIDAFLEIGAATIEAIGQNHLHPWTLRINLSPLTFNERIKSVMDRMTETSLEEMLLMLLLVVRRSSFGAKIEAVHG